MKYTVKRKGFTLVEMLVVIGLMLLLLVMVIGSAQRQRLKARDDVRIADLNTIRLGLEEYKLACGEYPKQLLANVNNGHCPNAVNLGSFLSVLPSDPKGDPALLLAENVLDQNMLYGGYAYAGISTRFNGPCFEYHIAAGLEAVGDSGNTSARLRDDHDFEKYAGSFGFRCLGSSSDFGNVGSGDDEKGLYDLRSVKNN